MLSHLFPHPSASKQLENAQTWYIIGRIYGAQERIYPAHARAKERERERGGRKPASAKYCINKCTRRNIHGRAKPSPLPLSFPPFSRHYPPFRRSTISFFTPWTIKPRRLSRISTPRRSSSSSSSRISEIPDSPPPLRKARIYSWECLSVARR